MTRLDDTIYWAVKRANELLPQRNGRPGNVHFVDWRTGIRVEAGYTIPTGYSGAGQKYATYTSPNGLCNTAGRTPFINGYVNNAPAKPIQQKNSFHPNSTGYWHGAVIVSRAIGNNLRANSARFTGNGLAKDRTLYQGNYLLSPDVRTMLILQADGNLVVYGPGGKPLWSTQTHGQAITRAVMQADGNFVLYRADRSAAWSTRTNGMSGAQLTVQDDGNVVLYRNGKAVWATGTRVGAGPRYYGSDTLKNGATLDAGRYLRSSDRRFVAVLQGDGNLVVYRPNWRPLWSSRTNGQPVKRAVMQADGNFVLYRSDGRPAWATGTDGRGASRLVMQSDGNLVVYDAAGRPTWASNTVVG